MRHGLQTIRDYHEATKHSFRKHAPGPGYLDHVNRPHAFRHFAGCDAVALPRPAEATGLHESAELEEPGLAAACRVRGVPPREVDAASISELLYHALAISAWRRSPEATWALRCNPSSGNLHSTETYLLGGPWPGLAAEPAVLHYNPRDHACEMRAVVTEELAGALQARCPAGGFHVGLTTIPWRQAWKYGERGLRYCHLDAGHAIGALAFAAARLGWTARLVDDPDQDELTAMLGVGDPGPAEPELAVALLALAAGDWSPPAAWTTTDTTAWSRLHWRGRPSRLSRQGRPWPLSSGAAGALAKPASTRAYAGEVVEPAALPEPDGLESRHPMGPLLRGRRSALALDGQSFMKREAFTSLLASLMPHRTRHPWSVLPWRPRVDLLLHVHRVAGLKSGLYLLLRDPGRESSLRDTLRRDYLWSRPEGCPETLPLYRLATGDQRHLARLICCVQDLASEGCFTVGMLADVEADLERYGPWFYARLHWECGVLGQALYLGLEAAGLRGCGLGCFFDDVAHEAIGLPEGDRAAYQFLYHFAAGAEKIAADSETLPAYPAPPSPEY